MHATGAGASVCCIALISHISSSPLPQASRYDPDLLYRLTAQAGFGSSNIQPLLTGTSPSTIPPFLEFPQDVAPDTQSGYFLENVIDPTFDYICGSQISPPPPRQVARYPPHPDGLSHPATQTDLEPSNIQSLLAGTVPSTFPSVFEFSQDIPPAAHSRYPQEDATGMTSHDIFGPQSSPPPLLQV